jgi:hypothetical protein
VSAKDLERQDREDFAKISATPEGARFIAGLLDFCGVFNPNEGNSAYQEGMRNVGLMAYGRIRECAGAEAAYIEARDGRRKLHERKGANEDE